MWQRGTKCAFLSVNHVQDCKIYSHKPSCTSAYVTVRLNKNAEVKLKIDTGASCNILPKGNYIRAIVRVWKSHIQRLWCLTKQLSGHLVKLDEKIGHLITHRILWTLSLAQNAIRNKLSPRSMATANA